ncbi:hypothetical protein [uncultured Methanoregula sp.]|uniref:hypothetical protein n=1 Tax=uncultured Methanoregula sp. TaxID=1005933 RepID=UPI002AAB2843|nr:hypothetical protein [uncultured Methanoregula sp.]
MGRTSLIRVRRLKYAGYEQDTIRKTCAQQISELQGLNLPEEIHRELWVRGPERSWHRYRVMSGTIQEVTNTPQDPPARNSGNGEGCGSREPE